MKKNVQIIEKEIESIRRSICANVEEGVKVVNEKVPRSNTFCKAVIAIYKVADYRSLSEGSTLQPLERFYFYPATLRNDRLGSVAIYGNDVISRYGWLTKGQTFYGSKILGASIENGARPFIDIKLAI